MATIKTLTMMAAIAAVGVASLPSFAETDVYGNEIKTYTEGGVQKTYQFWVSGDKAEDASVARKSSNSYTYASSLEARSKSVLSVWGKVASTVWTGLLLFIR